ncbi:MAG: type I glyceraldehyde-3-phosphate dehydrogenase [Patescibacteria group bacterium]
MTRIAINGFGRIGRIFFRQAYVLPGIEIVAINDLGDKENLAYLLQYDTVYGRLGTKVDLVDGNLVVAGKTVRCIQEKDPTKLPWKDLGIDIVVESSGAFTEYEKAGMHLTAGAKRVVITAPAKGGEGTLGKTILMGINDGELKTVQLSSNASCTTNAASPVIQILSENPGIEKAILNTVHAITATQSVVDSPVKDHDMRRGRAAAHNIVPSTTGAALAVTLAVKELAGKFDGVAMRVPVIAGSVADITFISKRNVTAEEINSILTTAANDPRWKGIVKVTKDQIVSSDIVGEPYGAVVDLQFTKVVDGNLVKVLSWYDNEWGYVATLMKHVEAVAKLL